jgi:uncharacterized protein (TIGR00297 family)
LDWLNLLLGLILSTLMALLGYTRGSLAFSGALGAVLVGTLIFAGGGWGWAILLIAFFITSSALSHYRAQAKEPLADKFQKGYRRDLGQVLANGGWGAILAVASALSPNPIWLIAYVGTIAAVNADTWATELGVLSRTLPRSIVTGRIVPTGTSGGVTWLGTWVALGGALLIGILAFALSAIHPWSPVVLFPVLARTAILRPLFLIPIAAVAGLLGSLFDSFLGATVQAIYFCDIDQKETESAVHRCGHATRLIRGWRWLDNDAVNFASSVLGSGVAVGLYWLSN